MRSCHRRPQLAAFREATREEDRIRGTGKEREAAGAYDVAYVDGADQIRTAARQFGTPSVLAAAAAALSVASAEGEQASAAVEEVEIEAPATLGQLWLRVPVEERSGSVQIENGALKAALEAADDRVPWRAFSASEFAALALDDVCEGSIIDAGKPGSSRLEARYYRVADVTAEQSPSAYGSPNDGLLFGCRPYLWPWPPSFALFGAFASVCLISYSNTVVEQASSAAGL